MHGMIRKKQKLSDYEVAEILENGKTCALAVCSGEHTYAVPLILVYYNSKIYFHGALQGQKLDEISRNSKVSFASSQKMRLCRAVYNPLSQRDCVRQSVCASARR